MSLVSRSPSRAPTGEHDAEGIHLTGGAEVVIVAFRGLVCYTGSASVGLGGPHGRSTCASRHAEVTNLGSKHRTHIGLS